MSTVIRVICVVAFLLSVAWLAYDAGFNSAVAAATTLATLLLSFFRKNSQTGQSQTVSSHSIGVQAGGNVHVDKIQR